MGERSQPASSSCSRTSGVATTTRREIRASHRSSAANRLSGSVMLRCGATPYSVVCTWNTTGSRST